MTRARDLANSADNVWTDADNANGITIATGEDAQVAQAFDLEVVKTAAVRNAEAEAATPGGE